jgi:UDP-N-acetylglucosamine 3-dehydrogenase
LSPFPFFDQVLSETADPEFGVIVEHIDGRREQYHLDKVQTNDTGGQTNSGVIDHFIEGIVSGKGPEINGEEGLKALKVIVSAIEAADKSKGIQINHNLEEELR